MKTGVARIGIGLLYGVLGGLGARKGTGTMVVGVLAAATIHAWLVWRAAPPESTTT